LKRPALPASHNPVRQPRGVCEPEGRGPAAERRAKEGGQGQGSSVRSAGKPACSRIYGGGRGRCASPCSRTHYRTVKQGRGEE
jgi:hypothetical protein